ncbi:C40 family peptidase [Thiocystis violacea]|uniref:C40 family peptidase n=1 Tax=Thiocystis violacea TaxID=13725 RepID=UPI001903D8AA|nr:C40 family peptidase [Thiocystis violacea]MBK1716770.1 glycoside hydrolase [Thiocystis violacea]
MRDCRAPGYPWSTWLLAIVILPLFAGCSGLGGRDDSGLAKRRNDVVLTGLAQIGTPYVYGGSAPAKGFDCSGLTYYAHHEAGLSIPRTAAAQHKAAKPVGKNQLKPGDMVFFKTGPTAYHVGLMIDGRRFVHASTSRSQVRVSNLDSPYWQARYLGAGTYFR